MNKCGIQIMDLFLLFRGVHFLDYKTKLECFIYKQLQLFVKDDPAIGTWEVS